MGGGDRRSAIDKLGRLTAAHNPAAQLAFAYDPAGQLLSETQSLPGSTPRTLRTSPRVGRPLDRMVSGVIGQGPQIARKAP